MYEDSISLGVKCDFLLMLKALLTHIASTKIIFQSHKYATFLKVVHHHFQKRLFSLLVLRAPYFKTVLEILKLWETHSFRQLTSSLDSGQKFPPLATLAQSLSKDWGDGLSSIPQTQKRNEFIPSRVTLPSLSVLIAASRVGEMKAFMRNTVFRLNNHSYKAF